MTNTILYPEEVRSLVAAGSPVAIGISGGKDSCALAFALNEHLDTVNHHGPRLLIHSDLGSVEWTDSIRTCYRLADRLGLQWAHVDFERRVLYIHRSKSGKPRTVPMSEEVYTLLFNRETSSTWVFTHPYHPTERLTEFKRAWDTACTRASLTDLRFHDLRHTAATRLAECGVEAFTIAGILGHSSIQTSARYAHASDAGKRRAVDSLAGYGKNVTNLSQNKKSGTF